MTTLAQLISSKRAAKRISIKRAAQDLKIKRETLEKIEQGEWDELPEPAFVKGFVKNYADYLGLDSKHVLALYRREYDESKYPKRAASIIPKRTFFHPTRIINLTFIIAVLIFIAYLIIQYSSILASPKLKVSSPPDDFTTSVPVVLISGQTEEEATVAIEGEFVPIDPEGNFSYQLKLQEGQNIVEIIASKKLSPKSKITKIIRLTR